MLICPARVLDCNNIDLSDVTNNYNTVLYRTVVVYEKKNRSLVFSGSRKIPTLGSNVQWETRQALFPTGTVGPRVGIFLSPLNTNDGFIYLTWVAMWDRFFQQPAYIEITRSRMRWYVRKNYLTWVKTTEISIWCARRFNLDRGKDKTRTAARFFHVNSAHR